VIGPLYPASTVLGLSNALRESSPQRAIDAASEHATIFQGAGRYAHERDIYWIVAPGRTGRAPCGEEGMTCKREQRRPSAGTGPRAAAWARSPA
jgi:hypothetical protein